MTTEQQTLATELSKLPDGSVVKFAYVLGRKPYTFSALWVSAEKRWYTSSAAPDRPSVLTPYEFAGVLSNAEWAKVARQWEDI